MSDNQAIELGMDGASIGKSLEIQQGLAKIREVAPAVTAEVCHYLVDYWGKPSSELMQEGNRLNFGGLGNELAALPEDVRHFRDETLLPLVTNAYTGGVKESLTGLIDLLQTPGGRAIVTTLEIKAPGFTEYFNRWEDEVDTQVASFGGDQNALGRLVENYAKASNPVEYELLGGRNYGEPKDEPSYLSHIYDAWNTGKIGDQTIDKDQLLGAISAGVRLDGQRHFMYSLSHAVTGK